MKLKRYIPLRERNFDGTGPEGKGPRTGRGMGPCKKTEFEEYDEINEIYKGEHSSRINDPKKYKKFRRQNDKFGSGKDVIWGITDKGDVELQAIRFDSKKYSPEEAQSWLKDKNYKPIKFEPAKEE
jgi:hypothetical protein